MGRIFLVFLITAMIMGGSRVMADEIWLKNGDHISGTIVRLDSGQLTLKTSYAGEISIKWSEIKSIKSENPVKVVLGPDSQLSGTLTPDDEGKIKIFSEKTQDPVTVQIAQIESINPPPPEPPLKTKARVNFGLNITDGNTETQNIYGDGELIARTKKNRFTLGGVYLRSEDDGSRTADSTRGYMKYDYFLNQKWYLYANATGEKDKFKDLDLRTSFGIGAGYQFLETDITNLSFEAGASYVNEDFIVASDNDFTSGRWGLRFDHFFWTKAVQFFHYHMGLQSLEDSDDLVFYSQTGFRIPFYKSMNITAQYNLDYQNNPSPGREHTDTAIIFTLGYQWNQ